MACRTISANCTGRKASGSRPLWMRSKVENVVDQAYQAIGVGDGDAQQVGGFFVDLAENAGGEQPQRPADGGERRAQFVADRGDELVLEPVQGITLADVAEAEHGTGDTALIDGWA